MMNQGKHIKQFSNFTFVKQIDLSTIGSKFNMSYRIRCLLEEKIKLTDYGSAIRHITFSPLIGEVFTPKSEYISSKKKLKIQYLIDPEKAIEVSEAEFFKIMLKGILKTMEDMELPEAFDFKKFKKDLKALQFKQLKQAA